MCGGERIGEETTGLLVGAMGGSLFVYLLTDDCGRLLLFAATSDSRATKHSDYSKQQVTLVPGGATTTTTAAATAAPGPTPAPAPAPAPGPGPAPGPSAGTTTTASGTTTTTTTQAPLAARQYAHSVSFSGWRSAQLRWTVASDRLSVDFELQADVGGSTGGCWCLGFVVWVLLFACVLAWPPVFLSRVLACAAIGW